MIGIFLVWTFFLLFWFAADDIQAWN